MRLRSDLRVGWRGWGSFAIVIGLVGAVVLVTASGARRTDTAYDRFLVSARGADALVAPMGTGLGGYDAALAKLPGVATLAPARGIELFTPGASGQGLLTRSGTDDQLGRTIERPKITEGRMFDPARPDEAVATPGVARALHLHVGQVLDAKAAPTTSSGVDLAHARPARLRIVGIGVTRDDVIPVNSQSTQLTLLTTPAFQRQFDSTFNAFDGAYIRLRPGASLKALQAQATALASGRKYHDETGGQIFVADEHQQAATVDRAIRPQALALAIFSLLIALVGLFVIGQSAIRRVSEAADDHVVLREIGMTRRQLASASLAEIGITAALGAVLAVVLAVLASPLMPVGAARIAEPQPGLTVDWATLGIGALAIVVLLLACVAWPVWRITSDPARSRVRPAGLTRLASVGATWGSPGATVGLRLAAQPGGGRSTVRLRTALGGTVVAIVATAAALTFGTNLAGLVNSPRLYGQTWNMSVDTQFGSVPSSSIEKYLGSKPGVTGWTYGDHQSLTIDGTSISSIGLRPGRGPIQWPTITEGRSPKGPNEIVLGSKSLDAAHVRVGQKVQVTTDSQDRADGSDKPRTMTVVGRAVFPRFGQGSFTPTGLGDGAAVMEKRNPAGYNFFLVGMAPGQRVSVTKTGDDLQRQGICPADQDCDVSVALRPFDIDNYARVTSLPSVLAVVLALLAMATLTHLTLTTTRRRRVDIAVLRTLGFVRRQVLGALAWQSTALLALALVIGLPVGVAVGRWLWTLFAIATRGGCGDLRATGLDPRGRRSPVGGGERRGDRPRLDGLPPVSGRRPAHRLIPVLVTSHDHRRRSGTTGRVRPHPRTALFRAQRGASPTEERGTSTPPGSSMSMSRSMAGAVVRSRPTRSSGSPR